MTRTLSRDLLRVIAVLSLVFFGREARAQVVSQFTWNSNPVTTAAVGPNAITPYSGSGVSKAGGAGGTNGLAPVGGNINMTMAGSTFTSMQGIDVSIDFVRKENGASFFTLGNFDFGIATGAIYVNFPVLVGGSTVVKSNPSQFVAPNDGLFHTYRFVYNNVTGIGTLSLDGVTQDTYNIGAGIPLSWTGAGNATIGLNMDGGGSGVSEIDNLLIQNPPILLPLELLSFEATADGAVNLLSWETANEVGVKDFVVERSSDGVKFSSIGVVSAGTGDYNFKDVRPESVNFYRLRMKETNAVSYSPVKKVGGGTVTVSCYPNPVVDVLNVVVGSMGSARYMLVAMDGKVLQSGAITGGRASLNVGQLAVGTMVLRVQEGTGQWRCFTVCKMNGMPSR
jgi:hypothetical protein